MSGQNKEGKMLEYCSICNEPTGRAGRGDDSLYFELLRPWQGYKAGEEIGPLCLKCAEELLDAGVAEE